MSKTKQQKTEDLAELEALLSSARGVVFAGYRGTTVKDIDRLRRQAEKQGMTAKVYKLTLLAKALEQIGVTGVDVAYKQPVIVATSQEEETMPARLLKDLSREVKTFEILGGVLDKAMVGKTQALALAELPSKQDLRAALVRTINAPVNGFVNVLAGNLRGLVNVLNAIATK